MQNLGSLLAYLHNFSLSLSKVSTCLLHPPNGELHLFMFISIRPCYWFNNERERVICDHFNQINSLQINQGVTE